MNAYEAKAYYAIDRPAFSDVVWSGLICNEMLGPIYV